MRSCPQELEKIKNLLKDKYYKPLKELFLENISGANFPNIGGLEFTRICNYLNI